MIEARYEDVPRDSFVVFAFSESAGKSSFQAGRRKNPFSFAGESQLRVDLRELFKKEERKEKLQMIETTGGSRRQSRSTGDG